MDEFFTDSVSREEVDISTASMTLDVGGRELQNLDADVLVEVFSYLPQKELFEILYISKDWNSVVMGGSVLWRKVDVKQKWNFEAEGHNTRGNEIIRKILGFAVDVSFSKNFRKDENLMVTVGGWLAPTLQILKLPSCCIFPTFISILVSQCPLLESLAINGSLRVESGSDPIHIQHPALKSLLFCWRTPLVLTIHCPALTYLSTRDDLDADEMDDADEYIIRGEAGTLYAPPLNCPKLTSLH